MTLDTRILWLWIITYRLHIDTSKRPWLWSILIHPRGQALGESLGESLGVKCRHQLYHIQTYTNYDAPASAYVAGGIGCDLPVYFWTIYSSVKLSEVHKNGFRFKSCLKLTLEYPIIKPDHFVQ